MQVLTPFQSYHMLILQSPTCVYVLLPKLQSHQQGSRC